MGTAVILLALLAETTGRDNEKLRLLFQGWIGIAMIAAVGALGLALIAVLLAVWRRTLARQRRLEQQIRELRSSVTAIGDAWSASAKRVPGPPPHGTAPPEPDRDDGEDEDDEDDDPFNLFGGRDPLDPDDEEDGFDEDEDEEPPPGF